MEQVNDKASELYEILNQDKTYHGTLPDRETFVNKLQDKEFATQFFGVLSQDKTYHNTLPNFETFYNGMRKSPKVTTPTFKADNPYTVSKPTDVGSSSHSDIAQSYGIHVKNEKQKGDDELNDIIHKQGRTPTLNEIVTARTGGDYITGTYKAIGEAGNDFVKLLEGAQKIAEGVTGLKWGAKDNKPKLSEEIEKSFETTPDFPTSIPGQITKGTVHGGILMGEMALMPEARIGNMVIPKLPLFIGATEGMKKYGETGDAGETAKAVLKGTAEGAAFEMLGHNAGKVGKFMKDISKNETLGAVSTAVANALGFGGYNAGEQLLTKGEVDGKEFWINAGMGAAMSVPHILEMATQKATGNFVASDKGTIQAISDSKKSASDLRDAAMKVMEEAAKETNKEKQRSMILAVQALNNTADIKAISEQILKDPASHVEAINNSRDLSPEQKKDYVDKINSLVYNSDPAAAEAKKISGEIAHADKHIEFIQQNSYKPEQAKAAEIKVLEDRKKELQQNLEKLYKPKAEGAKEGKEITGTLEQNVGKPVNYNGVEGTLTKDREGNYSVHADDGSEHIIEGGLSGKTPTELGMKAGKETPTVEIKDQHNDPIPDNKILYDFESNSVSLYGKYFTYDGVESDKEGNTTAIRVKDATGKEKFIRNPDAVYEIEIQKILAESDNDGDGGGGTAAITPENIKKVANENKIKPEIKPAAKDKGGVKPVQQKGPAKDPEGPKKPGEEIVPNWNYEAENDILDNSSGKERYIQRMLPEWNRAKQRNELDTTTPLTYKGDAIRYENGKKTEDIIKNSNGVTAYDGNNNKVALLKVDADNSILHIVVAPEFQRIGIASEMIKKFENITGRKLDFKKSKDISSDAAGLFNKLESFKSKEPLPSAKNKAIGKENYREGKDQITGRTITKTIANGEKIKGTYKIVSSDDVVASHNESTFSQSEDFPKREDGKTANDRDYEHDKNAQAEVIKIAQTLDDRAIHQTPVVSKEGIVLDGNNRTMSRKLAAIRGTDAKYIEALKEQAELQGMDPEEIDNIKNPMLVFEAEKDMPYTTETFKKFNVQEKKEKSPVEKAVEISKIITDRARRALFDIYGEAEKASDITGSPSKVKELITLFQGENLLQSNELPRYFNTEKLTATKEGVAFIDNILLGSALKEEVIRTLDADGMGSIRLKVLSGITQLVKNGSLGENSLINELGKAIDIHNDAKATDQSVLDYVSQIDMFKAKDIDVPTLALAVVLDEKGFKGWLKNYNDTVGKEEVFGGLRTKENITDETLQIKVKSYEKIRGNLKNALNEQQGKIVEDPGQAYGKKSGGVKKAGEVLEERVKSAVISNKEAEKLYGEKIPKDMKEFTGSDGKTFKRRKDGWAEKKVKTKAPEPEKLFGNEPYEKKISDIKDERGKAIDDLRDILGNIGQKKDLISWEDGRKDPKFFDTLIRLGKTYLDEGLVNIEQFSKKLYADLKTQGVLFKRGDTEFQKDIADIYNKAKSIQFKNIGPDVALSVQRKVAALTENTLRKAQKLTWNKFYKGYVKHLEDISGNVKEALKNAGGEQVVMLKDISNKSTGKASLKIEQLDKSIFKGLKENEIADLGNIIQAKRTVFLDEMYDKKKKPRLNHEQGHTKEFYEAVLKGLETEDKAKFDDLSKRADAYFKGMQDLLDAKKQNGLINDATYEALKEQSLYSPRMFISHLDDIGRNLNGGKPISVGESGIKALEEGSEGLMDKDPRFLLATSVAHTYGIMAKNDAAKSLFNFAKENPENGVVTERKVIGNTLEDQLAKQVNKIEEQKGVMLNSAQVKEMKDKIVKENIDKAVKAFEEKNGTAPTQIQFDRIKAEEKQGSPIHQEIPTGKVALSAMVDGIKKDVFMDSELASEWVSTDPAISNSLSEAISWISGAGLLRATATGSNPLFAIANTPRDMGYIYFTTDIYSKVLPKMFGQIHKDMAAVAGDAFKRTGRYKEYIEEGGAMELMTHQGRFDLTKGVNEGVNKISHVLGYIGETSELLTRLAMRERGIKNRTDAFMKENNRKPNPAELKQIKIESSYDAANQLDFSQGGDWSKALNKFVPYFNANLQATRGLARAAKTDPKLFAVKAGQLIALAGGLTVYNLLQPGYDQVTDDEKARNYIFMLGGIYSTDKYGNKQYMYLKLPKSQEVQFMSAVSENAVEFAETGKARPKQMLAGLQSQSPPIPMVTQQTPIAEMLRTYQDNYDNFYDRKLWKGQEGISPELEFNETGKDKTPEIYKKLGAATGLSPERMRGALPKLLANTEKNPFFTIPGKAYNVAMEGMGLHEKDALNKTLGENVEDMIGGIPGKLFGKTRPAASTSGEKDIIKKAADESKLRSDDVKKHIDESAGEDFSVPQKDKLVEEFGNYVNKEYADQPEDVRNRMISSYGIGLKNSGMDYWYVHLMNMGNTTADKVFQNRFDNASEDEQYQMLENIKGNEENIFTPEYAAQLEKLHKNNK